MNGPLHAAHWFLERGWTPLPIAPRGKQPLLPWRRLQRERPLAADLERWWSWWPDANVGVVTGAASRLVVMDLDGEEALVRAAELGLPNDAPRVRTARGEHMYFGADGSIRTSTVLPGVDLRANGAYVVTPPSVHPGGTVYTWIVPPDRDPPPLPNWAVRRGGQPEHDRAPDWAVRALRGVEEGRRNATCARLAGYFLAKGVPTEVVEAVLLGWNGFNRPPLPGEEVRRTVAGICIRGRRQRTEALPHTEGSLVEFLAGPWAQDCTHGERSTYQALCIIEWVRGLAPGATLHVSYRELTNYGSVSLRSAHRVLSRLASRDLIDFHPAGQTRGLHGLAATIRRHPLLGEGEEVQTNQLEMKSPVTDWLEELRARGRAGATDGEVREGHVQPGCTLGIRRRRGL